MSFSTLCLDVPPEPLTKGLDTTLWGNVKGEWGYRWECKGVEKTTERMDRKYKDISSVAQGVSHQKNVI